MAKVIANQAACIGHRVIDYADSEFNRLNSDGALDFVLVALDIAQADDGAFLQEMANSTPPTPCCVMAPPRAALPKALEEIGVVCLQQPFSTDKLETAMTRAISRLPEPHATTYRNSLIPARRALLFDHADKPKSDPNALPGVTDAALLEWLLSKRRPSANVPSEVRAQDSALLETFDELSPEAAEIFADPVVTSAPGADKPLDEDASSERPQSAPADHEIAFPDLSPPSRGKAVETAKESTQTKARRLLSKGKDALSRNDMELALRCFTGVLQLSVGNPQAYKGLAVVYTRMGDVSRRRHALFMAARGYVWADKLEKASALYEVLCKECDSPENPFVAVAMTLTERGRTQQAQHLLHRARDLQPSDPRLLLALARLASEHEDTVLALQALDSLLAIHPEHTVAKALRDALRNGSSQNAARTQLPSVDLDSLQD